MDQSSSGKCVYLKHSMYIGQNYTTGVQECDSQCCKSWQWYWLNGIPCVNQWLTVVAYSCNPATILANLDELQKPEDQYVFHGPHSKYGRYMVKQWRKMNHTARSTAVFDNVSKSKDKRTERICSNRRHQLIYGTYVREQAINSVTTEISQCKMVIRTVKVKLLLARYCFILNSQPLPKDGIVFRERNFW